MSLKGVNPYLTFNGTAAQAIEHYVEALGATVTALQRFSEMPGATWTGDQANQVMHACLVIGSTELMVGDTMPGHPVSPGNNMSVCVQYTDPTLVDAQFAKLAEGGEVTMPLSDTFWGARFGTLVDRFGVAWMLNATLP